jgi:hypothetical protein
MNNQQFRFHDTITWDLLDPSTPTPEEFASNLAVEYSLSFRTTMEITESITKQIQEFVRRKVNRFYPPIVIKDAYGADHADRHFGPAEDAIGECFSRAHDAILTEGGGRRGRYAVISRNRNDGTTASARKVKKEKSGRIRPLGQIKPQRGSIEVSLASYWDCHNVHSIAMVN